jgi:hypothetical protein
MPPRPNFFIVGAPKCGTTALYEYMRHHPNVFMPELKEPHFFSSDLITYHIVKSMEEYQDLFRDSTSRHSRIGEASASYLLSTVAIPTIREFNPDARIIAMFRNPVDMVYSFHSMLLYWSIENVEDFETAWRLQERRSRGLDLPRTCREPFWLQYARIGQFGTQVERLLSTFPREQVKLISYDDFAASPRDVYNDVIDFLDIPRDNRTEFPRINENKKAKVTWMRDFVRNPPPLLRKAFRGLKQAVGKEKIVTLKNKVLELNTMKGGRPPLSPEFRAELVQTFRQEVTLLSRLWNRDLSHWV